VSAREQFAAHAKLNVFLRVLGPRDDGYHDVETLMLPIDLVDTLSVEPSDDLDLELHGPLAAVVPALEENLVLVAARALAEHAGIEPRGRIHLEKRIPVASGMGGGSADAAAALRALNDLWGCELDDAELAAVAAAGGADVPGLLAGGAVFADGRGTRVTPVHAVTTWWVVKPLDVSVRSADAYAWWDASPQTGPDPGALIAAVETGNVGILGPSLFNDLQEPVARVHPEIREAIEGFLEAGALGAVMTGSGPAVVALARHVGHAATLAEAVPGSFAVSGPASAG
jgi:4-diphosphocytidyl-2-C-methyl-D-erythritol kinase